MLRKRKFQRYEDPSAVKVKLYAVSGHEDLNGSVLHCNTRDISEGGICLNVNRELPVDTPIKLRVAIADPPSSFVHQAVVRWSRQGLESGQFDAGLEFIGSSPTHMEEWRRLLLCISSAYEISPGIREAVQGS